MQFWQSPFDVRYGLVKLVMRKSFVGWIELLFSELAFDIRIEAHGRAEQQGGKESRDKVCMVKGKQDNNVQVHHNIMRRAAGERGHGVSWCRQSSVLEMGRP